jgi:hypothetical protein
MRLQLSNVYHAMNTEKPGHSEIFDLS